MSVNEGLCFPLLSFVSQVTVISYWFGSSETIEKR